MYVCVYIYIVILGIMEPPFGMVLKRSPKASNVWDP